MKKTIAMVGADVQSQISLAQMLAACGDYQVHSFADPAAFLGAGLADSVDCLLLMLGPPAADGFDLLRRLARAEDPVPAVVTGDSGDVALAVGAMKLGAIDFLELPCRPGAVIEAIDRACARRAEWRRSALMQRQAAARVRTLSPRLRQVLHAMAQGRASKAIAYELGLSVRTVESYRAQLIAKLGVRTSAAAMRLALTADLQRSVPDRRFD